MIFDDYEFDERWVMNRITKMRLIEESTGPLTEIQGHMIDACINRGDIKEAEQFIKDWNIMRAKTKPVMWASRWLPGEHYYALDKKFKTLDAAIKHIKDSGYQYGGVRERHQYKESGG